MIEKKKDPLTGMTGKGNQKCPKSHAVIFVGHVKQFMSLRDIFMVLVVLHIIYIVLKQLYIKIKYI